MFYIYTQTKEFYNDIREEIRLFINLDKIALSEEFTDLTGDFLLHSFIQEKNTYTSTVKLYFNDICVKKYIYEKQLFLTQDKLENKRVLKRFIKNSVYFALKEHYKKRLPWGSLTGIRPTKLARDLTIKVGKQDAKIFLENEYDVTSKKIDLLFDILKHQKEYILDINEKNMDIYIGIPFCVSRCKYCSFVSREASEHLKEEYLQALLYELNHFDFDKYNVRSVYIGGGTPTALNEKALDTLLFEVNKLFPTIKEFTVEAGRADTITKEKLSIIKSHNVNRISINSQTTNDNTLKLIGRNHSAKEFFDAFELINQFGFENVNTDIILGLPNESIKEVAQTLNDIAMFKPSNITVHTLALKRASEFVIANEKYIASEELINEMLDYTFKFLSKEYIPYYLYRQKYMSGNLENVGFAMSKSQCIYNIDIMEELVSNCAFGAGGISKVLFHDESRIERVANPKDVKTYISNIKQIAKKKTNLFYNTSP